MLESSAQHPTRESGPTDEAGLTRLQELHQELGRITHISLPEFTIHAIVKDLPDWTYGQENVGYRSRYFLHRKIMDGSVLVDLPESETENREVLRDKEGVKIRTAKITGGDLRCAVGIEMQLDLVEGLAGDFGRLERMPKEKAKPERSPEALRFRAATNTFLHEDDLFTDKEAVVLSHMTYCDNFTKLGAVVEVGDSTISRLVAPVRERVGAESNIDLMLVVIAEGVASIDHIPKGQTALLNERDRQLLAEHYSLDPDVRAKKRARLTDGGRWSRMYDKLEAGLDSKENRGIEVGRHWTVLSAVKDGVIELPPRRT